MRLRHFLLAALVPLVLGTYVTAQDSEGGFIELSTDTAVRAIYDVATINTFMPSTRTSFTFPAPYNTRAWRVTLPSDCHNVACVDHMGYSYWRRLSNSGDNLYIMVGLNANVVGSATGPTLFKLVKSTGVLTNEGAVFSDANRFQTGEDMYFSASQPTKLYHRAGISTTLNRIDVLTHVSTVVFDIGTQPGLYGSGRYIWQPHSSANDDVHSFSVAAVASPGDFLGCGAYIVHSNTYKYYPRNPTYHDFDECSVDQSGTYLQIKEKIFAAGQLDNRVIRLSDDSEVDLSDPNGAGGHSDNGYGYTVMDDNYYTGGHVSRLWNFNANPPGPGTDVYRAAVGKNTFSHVSHLNAVNSPANGQWVLASGATTAAQNDARTNEIIAFKLDGSRTSLVIAPVMTNLPETNYYDQLPFANVDSAGRYAIWTTNLGVSGGPLTAILVRIPSTWNSLGSMNAPSAPTNLRILP